MCMVLYYLINDTINKLLMTTTTKKGLRRRARVGAAKLDLFCRRLLTPFVEKQQFRINEENWWHYDPHFLRGLLELTSFQNSALLLLVGGFLCGGKKAASNLSICRLLQRHTSLSQFTTFFFFSSLEENSKNHSWSNFRTKWTWKMPHFLFRRRLSASFRN